MLSGGTQRRASFVVCNEINHYSLCLYIPFYFFSFTPYPAYSKAGRGNLVLRYFVPFSVIRHCISSGVTQRRAFYKTEQLKTFHFNEPTTITHTMPYSATMVLYTSYHCVHYKITQIIKITNLLSNMARRSSFCRDLESIATSLLNTSPGNGASKVDIIVGITECNIKFYSISIE